MSTWAHLIHVRQLWAVARTHPEIVESKAFCPLAKEIASGALLEDLPTLETCDVDRNQYSVPVIAHLFKEAEYKLENIGIDIKKVQLG